MKLKVVSEICPVEEKNDNMTFRRWKKNDIIAEYCHFFFHSRVEYCHFFSTVEYCHFFFFHCGILSFFSQGGNNSENPECIRFHQRSPWRILSTMEEEKNDNIPVVEKKWHSVDILSFFFYWTVTRVRWSIYAPASTPAWEKITTHPYSYTPEFRSFQLAVVLPGCKIDCFIFQHSATLTTISCSIEQARNVVIPKNTCVCSQRRIQDCVSHTHIGTKIERMLEGLFHQPSYHSRKSERV